MPNIENNSGSAATGLDDGTDGTDATGGSDEPPSLSSDVVLRAQGIEKTYGSALPFGGSVEVLTGAALTVEAGELVGIVGANGSGKSTLLRVLVGDLAADAGSVDCSGRVGWCPQETRLYDRLTVRETFDLFGEAYGMADERVAERRDDLAERLDFERFLDRRVDRLSGGNRQKVNLAVALLPDPDVLLLDEPYTGFDWETYLAFWDLTDELRERGTATVIISHFVEERERFDRVLELADGELQPDDGTETDRAAAAGDRVDDSNGRSPEAAEVATDGGRSPTEVTGGADR